MLLIATSKRRGRGDRDGAGHRRGRDGLLDGVVFTAIFVAVILQASVSGQFGGSALLAIPLDARGGASGRDPVQRRLGQPGPDARPCSGRERVDGIWIYLIAPPLGAVLAVGIWKYVHGGRISRPTAPTAEVLSEPDTGPRRSP